MAHSHPFNDVAALDKLRDARLHLVQTDAGVVRLSDDDAQLWIMVASENGSIMDRWAADSEMEFLILENELVAQGPEIILAAIEQARKNALAKRSGAGQ